MKVRRQRGATLGLVAACVFLVIIVGVGFFFLSKIIGGGREVANATDAGALNVAKLAVRKGAVPLGAGLVDEFGALTEPANSNVDLVTYNRLVAQALIVGRNAEQEGTGTAIANAKFLAGEVKTIGAQLRTNLANPTTLGSDFTDIASKNNTKMWNGEAVGLQKLTAGYMKQGSPTNVYFAPNTLTALGGWPGLQLSKQSSKAEPAAKYIAGYQPFNVVSDAKFLYGVPVLPQTKPHLVDHGQFSDTKYDDGSAVDTNTPPNSFLTNSKALEAKSGNMGGSVACAIVGVINKEFQATIPRGFVRVLNGNDATVNNGVPTGVPVSDGANDIFNNELFAPPGSGVYQANTNGTTPVFSTSSSSLSKAQSDWAQYDATLGKYPKGTADSNGDPNYTTDEAAPNNYGAGDPVLWKSLNLQDYLTNPAAHNLRTGGTKDHFANFAELVALGKSTDLTNCVYYDYDDNLASSSKAKACIDNLDNWSDNFGRNISNGGSGTQPGGFTNVEYMKADLLGKIAGRKGGHFCASVSAPGVSGLKAWPTDGSGNVLKSGAPGSGKPYVGGGTSVNYLNVDTPLTYLKQLGATGGAIQPCAYDPIIDSITKRMQQVEPKVTKADVESALNSTPLTLGGTGGGKLYLYVDSTTSKPKMTTTLPWKDTDIPADGAAPSGANKCDSTYPLNGWAVNTSKDLGAPIGDGGYHEVPFTQPGGGSGPKGTDSALWHAASGYNNLLGELKFEQVTEGATFCKPN